STNYSISYMPGHLTVTPAPLTVTGVDRQKVFDGLPYPFNTNPVTTTDVGYSGFVLGENPSVLGGPLSFSQGATTLVGSYTNTASGLTSTNYAIAYVPAKLSILAWTLAGFYQPVDMNAGGMIYNTVKGGSTVPMKFNIYQSTQANTNERTDVGAVKSFTASPYVCTAAATDDIEIVSTGGTVLRYDTSGQQFIQNWATPKSPGTCYKVTMTALDGSALTAYFKLK
ncbi:MAG TPA: PxKF domain-containing protein, partial [Gemmatimonadaceae bacterium]